MTIPLDVAKRLPYRTELYSKTESDSRGRPKRIFTTGRPKTWKRNPQRVEIPYIYGLYTYGRLDENDLDDWTLEPSF